MTRGQHGIGSIDLDRRGFLGLVAAGSVTVMGALAGCGADGSGSDASSSAAGTSKKALSGRHLTFVGDDAFAPYRYVKKTKSGKKRVAGLDIAVADELARRLGFTYEFEAQEFSATLASVQSSDTSFTMAMSSNKEREGVLTLGGKAVTSVDDLKGKSIACTTGTVQNKFVEAVLPDGDIHTYDGGTQCLQEVLAGRIDAYLCDGAEGQSMRDANKGLVLGLLDRKDTQDYVGVYRVMATKGATFVKAFDQEIGKMLQDGTLDRYIKKYVGADFAWGDDVSAAGTATEGVK